MYALWIASTDPLSKAVQPPVALCKEFDKVMSRFLNSYLSQHVYILKTELVLKLKMTLIFIFVYQDLLLHRHCSTNNM